MCDKELLVDYVYDELQSEQRVAFEVHLDSCAECRAEVQSLRVARGHLSQWVAPEVDLGFQVTRRGGSPASRRFAVSPAWGLAAAAVLVLGVAAAIAHVEVRAGSDGLVIRTGWNRAVRPQPAPADASAATASRAELELIRRQLSNIEADLRSRQSNAPRVADASSRPASIPADEIIRTVRLLIAESERRQQGMLATRLLQAMRDVEAAHRTDLVRLQQDITQTQGLRDAEVIRQREMLNQFYRLVGQK